MRKGIPFIWDELAEKYFDALKYVLIHAKLLHPPDYHQDYFLLLAASDATIGMVLIHEDESNNEHVIYYLNQNLTKN